MNNPRQPAPKFLAGNASRLHMQAFAVLASREGLQSFCDDYFNNSIPREIAYFRPMAPLVLCAYLNYGEMGSDLAWQFGIYSQQEFFFYVPLERYRWIDGALRFVEYGLTTPYIFVDNSESAVQGRERFGFPKQQCGFDRHWPGTRPDWAGKRQHVLTVETFEPSPLGLQRNPLVHILHRQFSANPIGFVLDSLPLTAEDGSFDSTDLIWFFQTLQAEAQARLRPRDLRSAVRWLRSALESVVRPQLTIFNLRQFADSEAPSAARYQDLVRMQMETSLQTIQPNSFINSWTGRYDVALHRHAVLPIASRLGLRIRKRHYIDENREHAIDEMPVFFSLDAEWDAALTSCERLCWRTKRSGWRTDDGHQLRAPSPGRVARYNDVLGPSTAAFLEAQPEASEMDVKVLLLEADPTRVKRRLDTLLGDVAGVRIDPIVIAGRSSLRIELSWLHAQEPDAEGRLVWLDGYRATLGIPVTFQAPTRSGQALFILHDFGDNPFRIQSERELASSPMNMGAFDCTGGNWFSTTSALTRVLRISAMGVQRSATAARVKVEPILDLYRRRNTGPRLGSASSNWSEFMRVRDALAWTEITSISDPSHVWTRRLVLVSLADHEELEDLAIEPATYEVDVHPNERLELVAELGLVPQPGTRSELPDAYEDAQTILPFASREFRLRVAAPQRVVLWESVEDPP